MYRGGVAHVGPITCADVSSSQSSYSDDRGTWFAGEAQPYPDPGWESRSGKDAAQHYPQQLPYEEPAHAGPGTVDQTPPLRRDAGNDRAPAAADREWPRGDPELAAVVRRDADVSAGVGDDGYRNAGSHYPTDPAGHAGGTPHQAGRTAAEGPPTGRGPYGAAPSIDPPTTQVPTFAVADGIPPPHVAPAGQPEAGVPPVLASMMQPGVTGGHPTQPAQPRRPDQMADGTYRTKRPGSAVALVLVTLLFAMPPLVLLSQSVLDTGSPSGVIGGMLALLGLPLLAMGLHPLIGGGASTGARELTALLRPPYLYLLLGLVLLVGAGLAAG